MSTVTLSKPHCAITSAEKPDGIASQAFTTALPEAHTFLTLLVVMDRVSSVVSLMPGRSSPPAAGCGGALSPPRYRQARAAFCHADPHFPHDIAGDRRLIEARSGADLAVTAEVGGGDGLIAPQLVGLAAEHDPTGFQHEAVVGDRKSHPRVLLDEENRGVLADLRN